MSEDLYKVLGIQPEADDKEVRSAYRSLVKKYHPDAGRGSSGEKFRAVQHAYDVLGDAERRAEYDRDRERPLKVTIVRTGHAPASHIDLRHLGRHAPPERIEFGQRQAFIQAEADAWQDLIAFLLGDI